MKKYSIEHEGHIIPFVIQRKKVKNVNLKVRDDSSVVVSAHEQVPYDFIESFVSQKAPWILKNIKRFNQIRQLARDRNYENGEIVEYLGRPYRMVVNPAGGKEKIDLQEEEIHIFTRDIEDSARKAQLLDTWYKKQAEAVFQDSLGRMINLFNRYFKLERPKLTIRTMKTRWGSCSWNRQKITLNTRLITFPVECTDYVVLHELVHFRHQRHDDAFYDCISGMMPDWKKRRKILRKNR